MSQVSTTKFDALRTQLFTGAVPEMTLAWLLDNITVPVSKTIPDAWHEMLAEKLGVAATGSISTDWFNLLRSLGFSGAISDMELDFWEEGGVFTLPHLATFRDLDSVEFRDTDPVQFRS